MIFVDTNLLISGMVHNSGADVLLRQWLREEQDLRINVIVWAEFACGPVSPEQLKLATVLFPQPEPLLAVDAMRGAELFNTTGRRRGSLADCLIAATCLRLGAAIATANVADFRVFAPMGLSLVETENTRIP